MSFRFAAFTAVLTLTYCAFAQSHGLYTSAVVGVTNNGFDTLSMHTLDAMGSTTGAAVSASGFGSYGGMNSSGAWDTMSYYGEAKAVSQYGQLKTYGYGKLENSFYNFENPVYYNSDTGEVNPDGTPDRFVSYGQAQYEDYFEYSSPTGNMSAGVKVDFWYYIHGRFQGDGAFHSVLVENDGDYDYILLNSTGGITEINQIWTSKKFVIGADLALQHKVTMLSQFDNINTQNWDEGSTVEGEANFYNTVTLGGMNLYDENDNLITSWTMSSASGTDYQAVPEPATMTVLGIAALAALKRKRKI